MTQPQPPIWHRNLSKAIFPKPPLQVMTFLLLGGLGLFLAFSINWLLGHQTVTNIVSAVYQIQLDPPWFVDVPEKPYQPILTAIFLVLLGLVFGIMWMIPKPTAWAKGIIAGILIAFSIRYVLWRSLATLGLGDPWSGILSLVLLFLEVPFIITGLPLLFWWPKVGDRTSDADHYETSVKTGQYLPTVDIFIPTYNEPERIIRRTIIGCQAIDYPRTILYVLDDGQRENIQKLTQELGCKYITRGDRHHAKAGNLNHALQQTDGDLIAVFDADFVPTRNFLQRIVGFFQAPDIGLVQSHQNFYNPDPIVRNLGLAHHLTLSREEFSRQVQPTIDSVGATVCDGSGFVVRRSSLEKVGGFVTESLCEDYFTGVTLESQKQRVVYLNENLSAGLSAENLNDYIGQYQRWLNGSLQAFFIRANPLTVPGLTLPQRIGHIAHLSYWLTSFARLLSLCAPILFGLLQLHPILVTSDEFLYFLFLPYLFRILCLNWLSDRSSIVILSEIYSTIHAIPFSFTALQTLLNPFGRGFHVTPKGVLSTNLRLNLWLTVPLALLALGNIITLLSFLGSIPNLPPWLFPTFLRSPEQFSGIGVFWCSYNLILLGLAILACLDAPKVDASEWFQFKRPVLLSPSHQGDRPTPEWKGTTRLASENGLRVQLTAVQTNELEKWVSTPLTVTLQTEEWPGTIELPGQITRILNPSNRTIPELDIQFHSLTTDQHRHLVKLLFCRPGQWPRRQHPSELQTLMTLAKRIIRPRLFLSDGRSLDAIPIQ